MLRHLRKNTKLIIWSLVISFALWGAFSVSSSFQKQGRYAGEVFGKNVSFQEYNQFYRGAQIFSFGQDFSQDPELLRQVTWQNLIYSREAKRKNFKVTDDEVRQEVLRLLAGQGFTAADSSAYKRWIKNNLKIEPRDFENQLREVIRVQKLLQGLSQTPVEEPKEDELQEFYLLENTLLTLEGIIFEELKEAEDFWARVRTPEDWQLESASRQEQLIKLPESSLAEAADALRIETSYALELQKLSEGSISQPIPLGGRLVIFYIASKKDPAAESLTEEMKKTLTEKTLERKKQLHFMSWHVRLMKEASLKDYTATPEN